MRHELLGDAHVGQQLAVDQTESGGNGKQAGHNVFL